MRRRQLYVAPGGILIKRMIPTGGGVHVYRIGIDGHLVNLGHIERHRIVNRQREEEHVTVWMPVNKDASIGAPQASLRDAVERIVRVHDIHTRGYTNYTLQKGR